YESLRRAEEGRITKNPWTGQLNAHPIYNWNALDTWLYIFWRRLPANPLYGKGLSRIGCWPCPSSNLADFRILKNIHPNLYEKLRESISSIARSQGFSQEDINKILQFGVWRWRKIPRKFLEIRGIKRPLQKILKIHNLDKEYIALDLPKMPRDDWEKFKCFLTSLLKQIEKQNSN
ncbi:MAG: phosphoadenosine phosphosulfate reductase domain-containing protein, partial [Candidatus Njordarchaeales archaeon]